MPESAKLQQIFRFIANLGRGLEMEIVAEGVEEDDELAIVREAGCHFVQGYIYGKPQSGEEILGNYCGAFCAADQDN